MIYFTATSQANAYGSEAGIFFEGKPHFTEIKLNHEASVTLKPHQYQYLPDVKDGCQARNFWDIVENAYILDLEQNCPNQCSPYNLPSGKIDICPLQKTSMTQTGFDYDCAKSVMMKVIDSLLDDFIPPCSKLEYRGSIDVDQKIDGFIDPYKFDATRAQWRPYQIILDFSEKPVTVLYTYNFERTETKTVYQEYIVVSFEDLIGNVGGMLSLFIGFSFIDNILSMVGYLTVLWEKINNRKKISVVDKNPETQNKTQPGPKPNQNGNEDNGPDKTSVPIKEAKSSEVNEKECEAQSSDNPEIKERVISNDSSQEHSEPKSDQKRKNENGPNQTSLATNQEAELTVVNELECEDASSDDNEIKESMIADNGIQEPQVESKLGTSLNQKELENSVSVLDTSTKPEVSVTDGSEINEPSPINDENSGDKNMKEAGRSLSEQQEMIVNAEVHKESEEFSIQ